MRVPSIQAQGALPRPLLLPASAPVENSPKSKGKPVAQGLLKDSGRQVTPTVPLASGECHWIPSGGGLCCPSFFGDKCGWNSWALEPTLWGDPWGFHLGPEVLEGSRVAHPLAFLSLSWATFEGLTKPKNCGPDHPRETLRAESCAMKWDCACDMKNQETGVTPMNSHCPPPRLATMPSFLLLEDTGCRLGWFRW